MSHTSEEREIKIQLSADKYASTIALVENKATLSAEYTQRDEYFDTSELYLTNLNRGLRFRFNNGVPQVLEFKSLFFNTYARQDNPWYIEEIVYRLPLTAEHYTDLQSLFSRMQLPDLPVLESEPFSYEQLVGLFARSNLTPQITVTKRRQEYESAEATYVFDHIAELGYFLEIESKNSDPLDVLKELLPHESPVVVRNGYNDMVAAGLPFYIPNEEKQRKFKENPSWNVLSTEKELVARLLSAHS